MMTAAVDLLVHGCSYDVDGGGRDEEEDDVVPASKAVGTHFQASLNRMLDMTDVAH